ncbi:MAG: TIM barrel protein [Candidatus Pacebacteria bacterium]|nr:TIM barrel protein [Candidatus Paceibacterota bacterium]
MRFGYVLDYRGEILPEIEFCKAYFDFIEVTIQPDSLKTIDSALPDFKKALGDLETTGHIHWEMTEFSDIVKNIRALRALGCEKIVMHPFKTMTPQENIKVFNEITDVLNEEGMSLLIENTLTAPYHSSKTLAFLLENIPGSGLALDVGHANKLSELDGFLNILKSEIKHVHLHDNAGQIDHLFFEDQNKLDGILDRIASTGYDGMVLLETFSIARDGENIPQDLSQTKKLHLEQLEKIKARKNQAALEKERQT